MDSWHEKNKDRIKEYSKKYYQEHRKECLARSKDSEEIINKLLQYKKQRSL
jgi:hypothetical protein